MLIQSSSIVSGLRAREAVGGSNSHPSKAPQRQTPGGTSPRKPPSAPAAPRSDSPPPPRKSLRIVDLRDLRRYADLRRIRDASIHDVIRHRARALGDADRAALEAVMVHGAAVAHIAAVMHRPVRTLRTHVRRLLNRVLSAEFACVQAHGKKWGPTRRAVGESMFVRGVSLRQTATQLGLPLHAVRLHADAVRALAEHARTQPMVEAAS